MLNTDRFEEFISQYPIYEYRLVDTAETVSYTHLTLPTIA